MENINNAVSLGDCTEVIYNDLKETKVDVLSYKLNPFSEKIEGLLGQHFALEITYKTETEMKRKRYFLKVLNGSSKLIFEMCTSVNAYEKEDFFYNTLIKEFRRYNLDTDFVPNCYFSKPYLIVLEDMSLKNYKPTGTIDLSLEFCKNSLRTIAKLHSCSLLYEAARSEESGTNFVLVNDYPKLLKNYFFTKENNFAKEWLQKSVNAVGELINYVPENHIKSEHFKKRFVQFVDRMNEIEIGFQDCIQTILHGDLWCNNFLYKNDGLSNDSVLVDFQIVKYGVPGIDVLNFLFCNTRKKFRDLHSEELINFYYECVKENLIRHGYGNIPSKEKYLLITADLKILLKVICLCDRTVTLLFEQDAVFETDEELRKYLLDERTTNLIKAFKKDDAFKEVIEEDLCELRDLLFEQM
ncbi:hypothetical protein FQR65_LT10903 [Abscondita terminalis]|nr:hypothetical protein FQR65_LT10903 [Abscondita terminalis]